MRKVRVDIPSIIVSNGVLKLVWTAVDFPWIRTGLFFAYDRIDPIEWKICRLPNATNTTFSRAYLINYKRDTAKKCPPLRVQHRLRQLLCAVTIASSPKILVAARLRPSLVPDAFLTFSKILRGHDLLPQFSLLRKLVMQISSKLWMFNEVLCKIIIDY